MKLLFAGNFLFYNYEDAFYKALQSIKVDITIFKYQWFYKYIAGKAEEKFVVVGPVTFLMNVSLLYKAIKTKPDVVFIWRGTQITPWTIKLIKKYTKAKLVSYNNDDPFSDRYKNATNIHQRRLWKRFKKTIPLYDLNFVFRDVNIEEYNALGSPNTKLLMPYYIPEKHKPIELTLEEKEKYGCEVVFVGHHEDDHRAECITELVRADIHVKLYGERRWLDVLPKDVAEKIDFSGPVWGDDYNKALSGGELCLCFLSKLNRDAYTIRCFEIPASRNIMLSEHTDFLTKLFETEKQALYFHTKDDLLTITQTYLKDKEKLEEIREAAYQRGIEEGYDVYSRAKEFVAIIMKELL